MTESHRVRNWKQAELQSVDCEQATMNRNDVARNLRRIVLAACVCSILSACAHLVTISYPPEAVIHPAFNQHFTTWEGERVQVALAPSLLGEALAYLAKYDQVLLANLVRQRGLHHEYEVAGKGTPLVVYSNNPELPHGKNIIPDPALSLA